MKAPEVISGHSEESAELVTALLPLCLEYEEEKWIQVRGWSMGSLLGPVSDIRIGKKKSLPEIGTIVLVSRRDGYVVHRVIARNKRTGEIVTKGDSCRWADQPVMTDSIPGVVTGVCRNQEVRIPAQMRFPWSMILAWNSRLQSMSYTYFPGLMKRWDIFRILYKTVERIEQWKLLKDGRKF